MIVPKPTDPEKLKKREEISRRLREYPNEELKAALEWIQAKKEQEEREKREREEKVSFIENLDLQTSGEKLWKFSNWKFIFNEGVEKYDGNWKYIEIGEIRYYEWSEGMNWFWYRCVPDWSWDYYFLCWEFKDGHIMQWIQMFHYWYKYVGQFKNDLERWQWRYTWTDWSKYIGQLKNGRKEWQWTYTCINWNILTWIWKNDFISEGKIKLKSDGTEIDVIRDRDEVLWEVTTEWEYKGKYIDYDTWEFVEP